MRAIVNASPLILLDKIDRLSVLNQIFTSIYIPDAVLQEITPDTLVKQSLDLQKVTFLPLKVSNRIAVHGLLGRFHSGEAEVLIGALEHGIEWVVLDERAARSKAKQLGLSVTGTLGVLLRAKEKGILHDLSSEIAALRAAGMYIADDVEKMILK